MSIKEGSASDGCCPSCGASGVRSAHECQGLFAEMGVREFSDAEYFRSHRLTVDAYCLQHPEHYMVSSKSAATHLTAMCWSFEHGYSLHVPAPIKAWVDGPRAFPRVAAPPPGERGTLTLLHCVEAQDPVDYHRRAREWADSAWQAWSEHWPRARAWVQEALAKGSAQAARHT